MSHRGADLINAQMEAVVQGVIQGIITNDPGALTRYSPAGWSKCRQDIRYHLEHLAAALACGQSRLFADYMAWAGHLFAALHLPEDNVLQSLELIDTNLQEMLADDPEAAADVQNYLALGKQGMIHALQQGQGLEEGMLDARVAGYLEPVLDGKPGMAQKYVDDFLTGGP